MTSKKWIQSFFIILVLILILAGSIIVYLDPFFHYHAPLKGFYYEIDNERYQNDGIMKNFEYDALITVTSITENFKTSELDTLFAVLSIKVSYWG